MKKTKSFGMVVAILLAIFCSGVSMAQMRGMGPGGMIPLRVLMELDLTDAQKNEISAIMEASKSDMETARQKQEEIRSIMEPVLTADVFNEENVRAACSSISPLMEEIMVIKARIGNQIKSVLTEAQQQVLEEKREGGKEKREQFAELQKSMLTAWLNQAVSE